VLFRDKYEELGKDTLKVNYLIVEGFDLLAEKD
jgi:hypothetical protein